MKGLPNRRRTMVNEGGEMQGEVCREGAEELADRLGTRRKATAL